MKPIILWPVFLFMATMLLVRGSIDQPEPTFHEPKDHKSKPLKPDMCTLETKKRQFPSWCTVNKKPKNYGEVKK